MLTRKLYLLVSSLYSLLLLLSSKSCFTHRQVNGAIIETKAKQMVVNNLCFFDDYSLVLYSQNGLKVFTREEALSQIVSVEMIDFPLTTLQEEYEDEFGSVDSNIVVMFIKRIKAQILQLKVSAAC